MELSKDNASMTNTALFLMASISESARRSVETESFRLSTSTDESTDQHILDDLFLSVIRDLETIGVLIETDYSYITSDFKVLFNFISTASFFLPSSLYPKMLVSERLRTLLKNIVEGNLGEEETVIQTYLSELGGLDGQDALYPEMQEYLEELYPVVSQTEMFTVYLQNLLHLLDTEKMACDTDPERHLMYVEKIKDYIGRFSEAVDVFRDDESYPALQNNLTRFIQDIIAPSNFVDYSYIFLENEATLPEELIPSYHRKWYQYYVSHPWFFEYYPVRNIHTDRVISITAICALYAFNFTRATFDARVSVVNGEAIDEIVSRLVTLYPETNHE